jgi:uncharacterized protein (TIGR03083 family)
MSGSIDFLQHLRTESARFREVQAALDPTAPVPSCPDWNASDLLWHLSEVQHSWATIVRDRLDDFDSYVPPERAPTYAGQLSQFDEYHGALVDALASTPDDIAVWTWYHADRSVGFVRRRQAHEALIHRLDAELTGGTVTEMDSRLAHDGVLEVLERMFAAVPPWATQELDGPVGGIATADTGGDWLVQIGYWSGLSPDTGTTYDDEPTLTVVNSGWPEFTVSGRADDLDCWLWNRPTRGPITLDGEVSEFQDVISSGVR